MKLRTRFHVFQKTSYGKGYEATGLILLPSSPDTLNPDETVFAGKLHLTVDKSLGDTIQVDDEFDLDLTRVTPDEKV